MNQLPKKISPCPIKEVICEIRFHSNLPEEAIFGVLYSKLQTEYTKVERLPILQLPQVVRSQDPNLNYAPHYKLSNKNTIILIGPKVFSLANVGEYVGWHHFSNTIYKTHEKVKDVVISNIQRVSL